MRLKENKGITLVALIITIIILLILAAVTIMSITGDGIISKSRQAKTDYEKGKEQEEVLLSEYLSKMDEIASGEKAITWTENGNGTYTSSDGRTVQRGDTFTNEDVLKLTGGIQSAYTGTWTILGIKNEKLKLVSTSEVVNCELGGHDLKAIQGLPNGTEYDRSIWSYKNAVNTLDTAAKEATGISSARSIKIEDIYEILGEENIDKGEEYGKIYNYYYDTTKSKVCYKYQIGTDENRNITWSTGRDVGETSQTFINSEGETIIVDSEGDQVTLTYTYIEYSLTNEQKNKIGNLVTGSYWLASPYVYCGSSCAGFHVRAVYEGDISYGPLFYSDGRDLGMRLSVRTIVYI